MNERRDNLRIESQVGFSLVEVMVGMVIALLGMVVMFQVFGVSESLKRTTTSGSDALQNGAAALFALGHSLREAGYGIFASTNMPPQQFDPVNTAPVAITAGSGAAVSDTIVLTYRKGWDYGAFPPDNLVFPSAVPPALTVETISVNSNAQLVSDVNGVISEGIALLKAEYGADANGNGMVDANEWTQTTPGNVRSVLAVRLVVIARSAQPEKPSVSGGTCDTTTADPTWVDSSAVPLSLSGKAGLAGSDDWKCYRYKTFENTVPLRNP